jgi:hypothetical protein
VLDASLWKGLPFHFKNPMSFRIIGTCEALSLPSEYTAKKGQPICQFDITPEDLFRRRLNIPGTDEFDVLSIERDE